ncbi:MAG TPA: hypothetical protein VK463_19250 [Desulfomonilaceae bacterium]|nr:hypothetical protein [Desulfomonilaceae bacterium]
MLKKIAVFFMGIVFAVSVLPVMAADKYVVIKDSKGRCIVRAAKGETPKTIAGPFATKKEAEAAKKEKCPPQDKKK